LTIETVVTRLARLRADPWRPYWNMKQRPPRAAIRALHQM
jgi:hypothetical protein